jgi:TPP-dependent trihydroxycyclohexane-1,2-dione (THcHDO) dehydratase
MELERYSDFTTASKTAFQSPSGASNVNISGSTPTNVLILTGDARATIRITTGGCWLQS